jgi:hypothetical protein
MSVLALENTHNTAGGTVWHLAELRETVAAGRELGLRTHLDGARLMNAVVASGVPAAEIASEFDTATLCLSKGLGCPLGALIVGSRELMHRARVEKHRFGGAMRQAGIVAAAGVYALDHNIDRLADDHAVTSLSFPSISTGAYLYPVGEAATIAVTTTVESLGPTTHVRLVRFVLFDVNTLKAYSRAAETLARSHASSSIRLENAL